MDHKKLKLRFSTKYNHLSEEEKWEIIVVRNNISFTWNEVFDSLIIYSNYDLGGLLLEDLYALDVLE